MVRRARGALICPDPTTRPAPLRAGVGNSDAAFGYAGGGGTVANPTVSERCRADAIDLDAIAAALLGACGVSLAGGLCEPLRSGVAAAAGALAIDAGELGRRVLARDPVALSALIEHSVVGETSFWRHPEQYAALQRHVFDLPRPLRAWCAGCASGEEPYSVAIALLESGRAAVADRILATDVSERALSAARGGVYAARALRRLPPELGGRWTRPAPGGREVLPEVRERVALARHNLVADPPPPGGFDLVVCRNVLIWFEPPTAAGVLERLAGALRPGGFLLLGPVELPLAAALALERVTDFGATLLRRPIEARPCATG